MNRQIRMATLMLVSCGMCVAVLGEGDNKAEEKTALPAEPAAVKEAGSKLALVSDKQAACVLVRGATTDNYAVQILVAAFKEKAGVTVEIVPAAQWKPDQRVAIILGTALSNPAAKEICAKNKLDVSCETLTEDGYIVQTMPDQGRGCILLVGGGLRGTIYAAAELVDYCIQWAGKDANVGQLNIREVPAMKYRWVWTWDNAMNWGGKRVRPPDSPIGGTYPCDTEGFLTDYKNCIDFMARARLNGLIVWGLFRDIHGGEKAAQEICRYAKERGVQIIPGIGTAGYRGYYGEGDHEFNLKNWAEKHPEQQCMTAAGKPIRSPNTGEALACPSKKETQEWFLRGAEWLFKNFEIGGVNLENGDFFACSCKDCRRKYAEIDITRLEPLYYLCMGISQDYLIRKMHELAPDAWLSYATYTGFTQEMKRRPPRFLSLIPDYAICQWTITEMNIESDWAENQAPAKHNIGLQHRWPYLSPARQRWYCRKAQQAGLEGIVAYDEQGASQSLHEYSYLALAEFCFHPEEPLDEFVRRRLAPLWGGKAAAEKLPTIIEVFRVLTEGQAQVGIYQMALELAKKGETLAGAEPGAQRRWRGLVEEIKIHLNMEIKKMDGGNVPSANPSFN